MQLLLGLPADFNLKSELSIDHARYYDSIDGLTMSALENCDQNDLEINKEIDILPFTMGIAGGACFTSFAVLFFIFSAQEWAMIIFTGLPTEHACTKASY
jgi:hypothetical protein